MAASSSFGSAALAAASGVSALLRGDLAAPSGDALQAAVVYGWLGSALWCLLASWATRTHSHVDKLWSVMPAAYAVLFCAWGPRPPDARQVVMAVLAVAWGARLTYNFARKGGYSGEEDYRWPVLRGLGLLRNELVWQLFNVGFICLYQQLLLLLIALPAYVALRERGEVAFGPLDCAAAAAFVASLALETAADEQQWRFQQAKHGKEPRVKEREADYARGFLTGGLFAWSRHPNFFAEQCIWVSFAGFAVSATGGDWTHWSLAGAALLILLFQGSTPFTESITLGKYPSYAQYQRTTSRLVPWPPSASSKLE